MMVPTVEAFLENTYMRRPLIGNGIPLNVPGSATPAPVTLFDTTDYTPDDEVPHTFAVTVFVWFWTSTAAASTPGLAFALESSGNPTVVGVYDSTYFDDLIGGAPAVIKPLLAIDRLIMRGDQQLVMTNGPLAPIVTGGATNTVCFVYGYFETVGETPMSLPYRPLQPSNTLVDPYNATPTKILAAAPHVDSFATAHLLSPTYSDLLTLHAALAYDPDDTAPLPFLRFPGAVDLPLVHDSLSIQTPMDGVPVIAPSASDNAIQAMVAAGADAAALAVYGSFRRLT